jgi:hypothetical protein
VKRWLSRRWLELAIVALQLGVIALILRGRVEDHRRDVAILATGAMADANANYIRNIIRLGLLDDEQWLAIRDELKAALKRGEGANPLITPGTYTRQSDGATIIVGGGG